MRHPVRKNVRREREIQREMLKSKFYSMKVSDEKRIDGEEEACTK